MHKSELQSRTCNLHATGNKGGKMRVNCVTIGQFWSDSWLVEMLVASYHLVFWLDKKMWPGCYSQPTHIGFISSFEEIIDDQWSPQTKKWKQPIYSSHFEIIFISSFEEITDHQWSLRTKKWKQSQNDLNILAALITKRGNTKAKKKLDVF